MNKAKKTWYSIIATFGAAGIWFAAMSTIQTVVPDTPLPLAQIALTGWTVTNDYQTTFTVSTNTYRIVIRQGFTTDLASLGMASKPLGIKRDDPCIREAALIHDALYATHLLSQDQADLALYVRCLRNGMERNKARAVYQAVKTWGWMAWEARSVQSVTESRKRISVQKVM